MIKVLGFQRILILLVLLGLNAALALIVYQHFIPQKTVKERELRSTRSQVATLQTDIDGLLVEFDQLDEQREEFTVLQKDGFFDGQNRRKAELIFKKIQERSGVISAVANVSAGILEDDEQAKKADHKLLVSPIEIKIEAVNDLDVFRYIYLVEEFFPGHLAIDSINLKREGELNQTVMRGISSGKNPPLVTADLKMSWRTMIPAEETLEDGSR